MTANRSSRSQTAALAAGFAVALTILSSIVSARGGLAEKVVDFGYDAWNTLYNYQNQSREGVIEAMDEGNRPDKGAPFTLEYLEKVAEKTANLYKRNTDLLSTQQELLQKSRELLAKLPKDHPRRAEVEQKTKQVIINVSDTRGNVNKYGQSLAKSTDAVVRFKKKDDVLYVPSAEEKARLKLTKKEETKTPESPPKKVDDLAKLKNLEANLEKLARALGKVRDAAVEKYINDPTPANRREAEAIKEQLVKLVEKLNETRHRVDEIEGTTRPDIRIRTAREIATRIAREAANEATRNSARPPKPEGHHHGPGGGDR